MDLFVYLILIDFDVDFDLKLNWIGFAFEIDFEFEIDWAEFEFKFEFGLDLSLNSIVFKFEIEYETGPACWNVKSDAAGCEYVFAFEAQAFSFEEDVFLFCHFHKER